jgi:hypothetical protein
VLQLPVTANVVPRSLILFTVTMEVIHSSETSVLNKSNTASHPGRRRSSVSRSRTDGCPEDASEHGPSDLVANLIIGNLREGEVEPLRVLAGSQPEASIICLDGSHLSHSYVVMQLDLIASLMMWYCIWIWGDFGLDATPQVGAVPTHG